MPQLPPLRGWLCVQYTVYYAYFSDYSRISENLPDYSRIFPDSFNHLLCSKLCRHNRRMPTYYAYFFTYYAMLWCSKFSPIMLNIMLM